MYIIYKVLAYKRLEGSIFDTDKMVEKVSESLLKKIQ